MVSLKAAVATIALLAPSAWPSDEAGGPTSPPEMTANPSAQGRGVATRPPETARSATLSPDGRWFACTIDAGSEHGRLLVRATDGDLRREIVGASDPVFAADSGSLIYAIATPGGFEYVARDLAMWSAKRSFRFPSRVTATPDARYLVIKGSPGMMEPAAAVRQPVADELFIYSPVDDRVTKIGPISSHEVSGDGRFIAMTREGLDGGTALDILRSGEARPRRVLETRGEVSALAWGDDDRSLVLVIALDKADGRTVDQLVAVDDVTAKSIRVRDVFPEDHPAWPKGGYLDLAAPRAGDAASVVYFRVRSEEVVGKRRPPDHDVEIHRSADPVLYDHLTDNLKEGRPGTSRQLLAWFPEDGRVVKVVDEARRHVILPRGGRSVLVRRDNRDSRLSSFTPVEWDVIDPRTGSGQSLGLGPVTGVSPSPTGRHVAYFARGHWWSCDTKDGSRRDLTGEAGPSFEADLGMQRGDGGPIVAARWLDDDRSLVAHDKHDAWLLRADGMRPRRLTRGRELGRTYRLVDWAQNAGPEGPHDFHLVEARSKHSGYVRVKADGSETMIAFGPWVCDKFAKARAAERFVFQRESYDAAPNFFTVTARGDDLRPMTEVTANDDTGLHPRRELIQYRDGRNAELQGTLIYPVDHDPGKKYPMVVLVYRVLSDDHFRFRRPAFVQVGDPLPYASRGYFVLLPDIVHRPREAGPSAVACVESAVREVLRLGLVDRDRVGLMGMSLGGYEAAFVLSKSRLFAAGVAGSPVVDWTYNALIGRQGNVPSNVLFEREIGMTAHFWEDPETFFANSVLYQAGSITAPLLIGVGRRDLVVDWREGEALFNLLRYLNRPAYLAAYPEGGHGLDADFTRRVGQFFDHYLKGEPPAEWLGGGGRRPPEADTMSK